MNLDDLTAQLTEDAEHLSKGGKRVQKWTKKEIALLRKQAKKSVRGSFSQRQFTLKIKELKRDGQSITGIHDDHSATAIDKMWVKLWKEENEKIS